MTIYSTVVPTANPEYRIFPLSHNFAQPVKESIEFLTDIITSSNGKEQRRAVRNNPRRTLTTYCTFGEQQKWALDRYLNVGLGRPTILADERLVLKARTAMPAEGRSFIVEGDPTQFPNGMVVLSDGLRKETRIIDSVTPNGIVFADWNDTPFPPGTRISPAVEGRLQTDVKSDRLTNTAGSVTVTMDVTPETWALDGGGAGTLIGNHELWTMRPNWSGQTDVAISAPVEKIDYGFGRLQYFRPVRFNTRTTKHEFIGKNFAEAQAAIRFFLRMKGRNREFMMQTGESDIPFYALAGNSFSVLVNGAQFAYDFSDNTVFRRVMFRRRNGNNFSRLVDYLEPLLETDTTAMWVTEALPGTDVAPSDIFGCSWCNVARFASDRLELEWPVAGVAQFAINFMTLENFEL